METAILCTKGMGTIVSSKDIDVGASKALGCSKPGET